MNIAGKHLEPCARLALAREVRILAHPVAPNQISKSEHPCRGALTRAARYFGIDANHRKRCIQAQLRPVRDCPAHRARSSVIGRCKIEACGRVHTVAPRFGVGTVGRGSLRRGLAIAAGSGYLASRRQAAKMHHRSTSSKRQSQLASGPTVPPVSHSGPEKLLLNRCPGASWPLSGVP